MVPRLRLLTSLLRTVGAGEKVVPENRYPMEPAATVAASTEGFFAISPGGTRKFYSGTPDTCSQLLHATADQIVFFPFSLVCTG